MSQKEYKIQSNQRCNLTYPRLHSSQASRGTQNAAFCGLHAGQHEEAG